MYRAPAHRQTGIQKFIASKKIRFDMKSFFLCSRKTGYIQDFIIYMGPGIKIC